MPLPTKIYQDLFSFLNPKIKFSIEFQEYFYDQKWLLNVNEEYFKKKTVHIIKSINSHLIQGSNNEFFLKELLEITEKKYMFFNENPFYKLESIENIKPKIEVIDYSLPQEEIPTSFNATDVINKTEKFLEYEDINYDYTHHMFRYLSKTNQYKDRLDFEKVKLLFVLELLKECLEKINNYVMALSLDLQNINIAEFNFDELMIDNDITDDSTQTQNLHKCHALLSKTDVANLFHFLTDEKLIYFHEDRKRNDNALQKFIENNFTYKDFNEENVPISRINKELGYVRVSEKMYDLQLKFIDKLIEKLQKRKQLAEDKISSNKPTPKHKR